MTSSCDKSQASNPCGLDFLLQRSSLEQKFPVQIPPQAVPSADLPTTKYRFDGEGWSGFSTMSNHHVDTRLIRSG
ncbi:MAG: hypothetical protein QNJ53_17540 [Pleurocapsa sp. MO_192.B19]|nr:hypothetical protein [Pleurocapsa sp. MO_192.B19]